MVNRAVTSQDGIGNRGHLIKIIVVRVNHSQFHAAHVLGIIFCVTACEAHVALHCEKIREESAREHDNEAGVGEMNAQFSPGPAETFCMRSDEINEQHSADEMATGENRDLEPASFRWPPHEHALEITLLRFVDPEMNLRQCASKNQRHTRRQTNDRQLQGRNKIDGFAQHVPKIELTR
jgi:hypothetical protein